MLPPSSTTIPANSTDAVTQEVKVTNTQQGEKNIVLKIKLSFTQGGKATNDMVSVSSFPAKY